MKKLFLLLSGVFCLTVLFSQTYRSTVTSVDIQRTVRPAISIVSEAEYKLLQKSWASYLKKEFNNKSKSKRNTVTSTGIIIPSISVNPVNVYAFFSNHRDGSEMILALEMSEGNFISQTNYTQEFQTFSTLAENFVKNYCKEKLNQVIKEREKALKKQTKQEAKLRKRNRNLERQIAQDNKTIQQRQRRIESNNSEIETNTSTLRDLGKTIEDQKNEIKELERRKEEL
ncbi:MAG: hypothetical protein PHT69_06910 [Bacteroidales bacterium]|nr:hypothetical protein [Bacteroidales bacterium]